MALERKHIFLIVGSVLILGAIGVGIYLLTKPKAKDDDPAKKKDDDKKDGENDDPEETITPPKVPTSTPSIPGKVSPTFNGENELSNPYPQLKDRVLYPKRKAMGGWDYTNVRSSPEVNTESAWYDPFDNLLTTINAGIPIGKVIGEEAGVYNNYSYRWFKVKLIKQVGFWNMDTGFVRGDTVTFAPYNK
jgi:hypothetical protein